MAPTSWVHGHPQVFDNAVFAEDLADMVFFDVSGQSLYYNLRYVSDCNGWKAEPEQASHFAFSVAKSLTFALLGAVDPSLGVVLRV